jgi:hypothetical protein
MEFLRDRHQHVSRMKFTDRDGATLCSSLDTIRAPIAYCGRVTSHLRPVKSTQARGKPGLSTWEPVSRWSLVHEATPLDANVHATTQSNRKLTRHILYRFQVVLRRSDRLVSEPGFRRVSCVYLSERASTKLPLNLICPLFTVSWQCVFINHTM